MLYCVLKVRSSSAKRSGYAISDSLWKLLCASGLEDVLGIGGQHLFKRRQKE